MIMNLGLRKELLAAQNFPPNFLKKLNNREYENHLSQFLISTDQQELSQNHQKWFILDLSVDN